MILCSDRYHYRIVSDAGGCSKQKQVP